MLSGRRDGLSQFVCEGSVTYGVQTHHAQRVQRRRFSHAVPPSHLTRDTRCPDGVEGMDAAPS